MPPHYTIVISLAILFLLSSLYALILSLRRVRAWYQRKNWTWVMLVIGVLLVQLVVVVVVLEVPLSSLQTWGLEVVAFAVAGLPIGFGEMLQGARQAGQNDVRGENGHDETPRW
jgi:uncharacterized membrane protein